MKNLKVVSVAAVAILILFLIGFCHGSSRPAKSDLSKILKTEWQAYKKGKPHFEGGLAMQILSPKGDYFISTGMGNNITNSIHFRIASVTKTFTAAGIMLLDQRGLLNINDKITDNIPGTNIPYLPDTPEYAIPHKNDITIRMLLMHRAGVFDVANEDIPSLGGNYLTHILEKDKEHTFTFDELVGVDAREHLSYFEPGASYHYSDTGYSMLGKIIERVSGKSYSDFIRDELLVPNKLLDTSLPFKGSDQKLPKPFVRGYVWIDNALQEVTESNMSPHVAEGNMITTPADLAGWCKKLMAGKAGPSDQSVEKMISGMNRADGSEAEYGLGISYSPSGGYGHSGAHEGYLTTMAYYPKTGTVYVIFTNVWNCQNGLDSIKSELKFMAQTAGKIFKRMKLDP